MPYAKLARHFNEIFVSNELPPIPGSWIDASIPENKVPTFVVGNADSVCLRISIDREDPVARVFQGHPRFKIEYPATDSRPTTHFETWQDVIAAVREWQNDLLDTALVRLVARQCGDTSIDSQTRQILDSLLELERAPID